MTLNEDIRFFSGTYPVRELAGELWAVCKKIYPTAERKLENYIRGYVALSAGPIIEDKPLWNENDYIRLASIGVYAKPNSKKGLELAAQLVE